MCVLNMHKVRRSTTRYQLPIKFVAHNYIHVYYTYNKLCITIIFSCIQDIAHDATLRVSVTKVLKPDQLVAVLFVTNQKQAEVSHVSLSVEKPSNTRATTLSGVNDLSMTTNLAGFGTVSYNYETFHIIIYSETSNMVSLIIIT